MKTIYNVYVEMQDQAQCNRMKQLCIDNGLPIWGSNVAFEYIGNGSEFYYVECSEIDYESDFCVLSDSGLEKVTEAEFIELIKTTK